MLMQVSPEATVYSTGGKGVGLGAVVSVAVGRGVNVGEAVGVRVIVGVGGVNNGIAPIAPNTNTTPISKKMRMMATAAGSGKVIPRRPCAGAVDDG